MKECTEHCTEKALFRNGAKKHNSENIWPGEEAVRRLF